uniref:Tripartite motif-containing protein 16-like n=1 Tax=Paramormyrops kingsleyae TaxID=1676925 RepID=A0A3B3SAZ0_9TELE
MAEARVAVDVNEFSCAICLDLLKDPVTIPCGHIYSCPQCRQTFTPRPVLGRNTILAEMVEKLKKTGLQAATPADQYAEEVECDICTGTKHKAVKSCLVCLASYCETDLQLHNKLHHEKQHKLIDAISHLQDKVCSHHDKPLEIYCRTDQQCVCYLCLMDEHRGHDTVSAAAGRAEIQKQMGETQKEFQQRIQMREKELQELREAVGSFTSSAQSAVEDSERIFTEMIRSIERRRSEVTKLIRDQEKAAVSQAEGHMERLKQEIDELKRRHSELEQFPHTEDHIHFLQRCRGLPVIPEAGFGPRISVSPHYYFENVKQVVSELKDQLENVCEKKTRECTLTLDPNTANRHIHLSEGNRVVTWKREKQSYPDHQERFDSFYYVLCTEGLTGHCYWEVEWSGNEVGIGVTYKGINRKGWGNSSKIGYNDKSWCLYCSTSNFSFRHNNNKNAIAGPPSPRIGVYLDHRAGTLSFYSVSDTMTLLHRVQATFTEPLYPGFQLHKSKAKLC